MSANDSNPLRARMVEMTAGLGYSARRYYDTQRVAVGSPNRAMESVLALRATAAEMARVLVEMAKEDEVSPDEAARALALALVTAMRGTSARVVVERLRATADWIERETAPASGARKVA